MPMEQRLLMLQSMGLYAMVTMWLPPLRSTIAFCVHWTSLSREGQIQLTIVPVGTDGCVNSDAFLRAIQTNTRLAVLTHASNVTGAIQPVAEVGKALRDRRTLLLCDVARSFGAIPVSVQVMQIFLPP